MKKLKICRQAFTSSKSFHVVDWPRTPSCTKKNARAKRAKLLLRVFIAVEGVTA